MRLGILVSAVAVLMSGCACGGGGDPDGGRDAGLDAGSGGFDGSFALSDLDRDAVDATELAMAIDPAQQRVGVAYFSKAGTETMPGTPDYELKYVEWRQGVVSPIQTVRVVQRIVGLVIVFDRTSGEPIVSYLGGSSGFVVGQSIFWFQSDAVINQRSGGNTWTETVVAANGNEVTCGNMVSDRGFLVGLWPALALDSTGKMYLAYRDAHAGSNPIQDWSGSDLELWEGPPPPTTPRCVAEGGNNHDGFGGHVQMVIGANDQPALVHDQMVTAADVGGSNVHFQRRNANGTWTTPVVVRIPDTQSGASLAYDGTEGYGIAVFNRSMSELGYLSSIDGTNFTAIDSVFGSGSGGWYPSLAMDPVNHEPAIAFYVCSRRDSVNEASCLTAEDSLMVTQRIGGNWRETLVDPNGGFHPKLGFFSSGKRVVVYRTPPAIDSVSGQPVTGVGALKIAVEK